MEEDLSKEKVIVPRGIEHLSDWQEFSLPPYPCIINKQLTGCGFTEWCIRNNEPIVLCSPRKILLKNKLEQHPDDVYYAKNEYIRSLGVDKDLKRVTTNGNVKCEEVNIELTKDQINEFKLGVKNALMKFTIERKAPKILVTYDSFRLVLDSLREFGVLDQFHVVVDEFQSIFTDSRFKANTEMEFVNILQSLTKVCFVSATPMMRKYLKLIDEFKDLPYYELDWGSEDPTRVRIPTIIPIAYNKSLVSIASSIINDYRVGIFEKDSWLDENTGEIIEVESREVVIFVNSVKNICSIIKKCELTFDETNVLCADTEDNKARVRSAFGLSKSEVPKDFLTQIPKEGEPHKMVTLCTKTAYLGADFYSTNARTVVLSDGSIECLAVDISLDLPQILGRQRLSCNPWKNYAELYFKTGMGVKDITEEEFEALVEKKIASTENMLNLYEKAEGVEKSDFLARLEVFAIVNNYRDDYIAIDKHSGSTKIPKRNNLVMIAERRAFDIQRKEYYDRFRVMDQVRKDFGNYVDTDILEEFIKTFNSLTTFTDRMKLLCITLKSIDDILKDKLLHLVPKEYKNYCLVLGTSTIGSLSYQRGNLEEEYQKRKRKIDPIEIRLTDIIVSSFQEGERYSRSLLKERLQYLYDSIGYDYKKAQATDIEKYFEVERTRITNPVTKKKEEGLKLIKKR